MNNFLPFYTPDIGEEEINEVIDCLRNGWLTTGSKAKFFENAFAQTFGENLEAIAVNSATAGLHLALEAIGIAPGDEVITTTYTFTATAEVIRYLGADPVFVDINPSTLMIDTTLIEEKITEKTKAIIPVHFAGATCDMDSIFKIALKYNLKIVEDAAHSLPATYKGKWIGSLSSDATVFSFYATKTMTTGEGGMILTKNKEIARRCRIMRLHGINRDIFDRYTSNKANWFYEIVAPGYKYNMPDIQASIGIAQLKKLFSFQKKRQRIAECYNNELKEYPIILPPLGLDGDMHSWHLYVIQLHHDLDITREYFIDEMAKRGIGCSVHFIPLHLHVYWREKYKFSSMDYPNATKAYNRTVSLPLYTKMSDEDQYRIIESINNILYK
ncbi:DegT/DnrJ/EryC1/StrS aminotransferase family protein [Xenorhabdus sp. PB62.4]|uniref:DegT/DnrJ/EryC1/StrS family aminotransferase n=1 Tax=Xenorhabdus sp. PB62.4 TaxID=1851573 RepID=UPI001656FE98|nr:DegT/DnrJ/EryC1/StrS aminotransferase family protein [Xenorhabdus sp. PB62.4]MBC8953942.1 lipopolysaccharide biosynthesis protein [Xenorhabdus sp. PB62.4]